MFFFSSQLWHDPTSRFTAQEISFPTTGSAHFPEPLATGNLWCASEWLMQPLFEMLHFGGKAMCVELIMKTFFFFFF